MGGRLQALDGLRALSVLGVILSGFHWLAPFGWIGVLVFYVLSGFLITRILVDERARASSPGSYLGRFYFRRSLRIFPLYFAYLLLLDLAFATVSLPSGWPEARPYAFTYTVNFGMMLREVEAGPAVGHLWTLSVEEQFYLLWPLVVWLVPQRSLARLAVSLILAGPLVRLSSRSWLGMDVGQLYVSSLTHVDAFAFGALLAVHDFGWLRRAARAAAVSGAVALALGLTVVVATSGSFRTLGYREGLGDADAWLWGYTVLDACAALLILAALRGELRLLGHPALAYVGKVSYGVYLFQRPLVGIYTNAVQPQLAEFLPSPLLQQLIGVGLCAAAAIGLASASYHLLEAPLLRWRDRRVPARASLPADPQAS
jgi:peptidoglycan/LPS O-acetylase OafA/YrhL